MNTPTPRTDAAWNATFDGEQMSAGRTARALRECSQQLETELTAATAERDHWQKIAVSASQEREHNANVAQAMTAERDLLCACLRNLRDEQNGAPLELRRTQWQAAMDEALAALTKTEGAK